MGAQYSKKASKSAIFHYFLIPIDCGEDLTTSSGVITSPNYPNVYPNNRDCNWTISVPAGQQIAINFTDFHIYGSYGSCQYGDYVEIR